MKVRLLTSIASAFGPVYAGGEVVDLAPEIAHAWIRERYADAVEADPAPTPAPAPVKTASKRAPEKR